MRWLKGGGKPGNLLFRLFFKRLAVANYKKDILFSLFPGQRHANIFLATKNLGESNMIKEKVINNL